jgi:hypothetical protein
MWAKPETRLRRGYECGGLRRRKHHFPRCGLQTFLYCALPPLRGALAYADSAVYYHAAQAEFSSG